MKSYIYLIAPAMGSIIAQLIKFVLELRKDGVNLSDAIASGGMPSSHTAGMAALTSVIGVEQGADSAIFGLAFAMLVVIIYDSIGVRRTTGENALMLKEVAKDIKFKPRQKVHIARGHNPLEVFWGLLLGTLVGVLLTKVL